MSIFISFLRILIIFPNNFQNFLPTFWITSQNLIKIFWKMYSKLALILPNHNYEGYFKSFASLIRSRQKINKWTSNKNKLSSSYNLLFNIITVPSEAFFILIDEFVDACGISHLGLLFGVYHFKVYHLYSFILPWISVQSESQLILW